MPTNKKTIKPIKVKIGQQRFDPTKGPFSCPVAGYPKAHCKPWISEASLHRHMVDHCIGKLNGAIPEKYFSTWNKQFCSQCLKMRKSFSPAKICNCCSNKKPSLVVDDISSVLNANISQQLSQSEAETMQDYPISNICLPSLGGIVKCKCPTLRHIPKKYVLYGAKLSLKLSKIVSSWMIRLLSCICSCCRRFASECLPVICDLANKKSNSLRTF